MLLTQRDGFAVPFSRPHTPQMDFFLQDEPPFDHEDLLDHGYHRGLALLADRRDSIHRPVNRDTLDFHSLVGERLINQMVVTNRVNIYANVSLDSATVNGDVFYMERDGPRTWN